MPKIVLNDPKAREKPCLRCGTSLRGHLDDKFCPKCGLSVWLSLNQNDGLDVSHPLWLRRCAVGCCVMALAQVLALPALALLFAPYEWKPRAYALAACIGGCHFLIYHIGMLLLAGYEGRHPDRTKVHRTALRIVAGVGLTVGLLFLATGLARLKSGWPIPKLEVELRRQLVQRPPVTVPATHELTMEWEVEDEQAGFFGFNGYVLLIEGMMIATVLATFAYLRRLAQRIPHSGTARVCGYLMFLPVLSLFKLFPLFTALLAFYLHHLTVYLPWVYMPFSAALLGWFAFQLLWASRRAKQNWDKESKPA